MLKMLDWPTGGDTSGAFPTGAYGGKHLTFRYITHHPSCDHHHHHHHHHLNFQNKRTPSSLLKCTARMLQWPAFITVEASCQCVKCQCSLHLPYCSWQNHTRFVYKQKQIQTQRSLVYLQKNESYRGGIIAAVNTRNLTYYSHKDLMSHPFQGDQH